VAQLCPKVGLLQGWLEHTKDTGSEIKLLAGTGRSLLSCLAYWLVLASFLVVTTRSLILHLKKKKSKQPVAKPILWY